MAPLELDRMADGAESGAADSQGIDFVTFAMLIIGKKGFSLLHQRVTSFCPPETGKPGKASLAGVTHAHIYNGDPYELCYAYPSYHTTQASS